MEIHTVNGAAGVKLHVREYGSNKNDLKSRYWAGFRLHRSRNCDGPTSLRQARHLFVAALYSPRAIAP
jgi:hypothetical protein